MTANGNGHTAIPFSEFLQRHFEGATDKLAQALTALGYQRFSRPEQTAVFTVAATGLETSPCIVMNDAEMRALANLVEQDRPELAGKLDLARSDLQGAHVGLVG